VHECIIPIITAIRANQIREPSNDFLSKEINFVLKRFPADKFNKNFEEILSV
jgi:hypothetical protein